MKAFQVKEGVFSELVNRRLMAQAAEEQGMTGSDEEVRDRIKDIPAFQKDGRFDSMTYKQVLAANNYTPSAFEKMIRDEISLQAWSRYFKERIHVSDAEVKDEYVQANDKRTLKYVLLTQDAIGKGIDVKPEEIQKFLADPNKISIAKGQFDTRKEREFKGKSFDQVKDIIAREAIVGGKLEEVRKLGEKLAKQAEGALTAEKSSDAKVNAMLKPYGVEVKTSAPLTRASQFIPGVGEAPDLLKDVFAAKSPINPADGGKAKAYNSAAWWVVAIVSDSQKPDLSKLDQSRDQLLEQIASRKERALYDAWMQGLVKHAKIEKNAQVVGET